MVETPVQTVHGGLRASLYRLSTIAKHNMLLLGRDPGPIIARILMPAVLLVVFEPLYKAALGTGGDPAAAAEAAPRVLVMFTLLSLSNVGTAMLDERTWRTWSRLRATQVNAVELLAGKALPLLGMILAQIVVGFGIASLAFGMRLDGDPLLLVGGCLIWALMILAVGALIATFLNSTSQLVGVTDVGSLVFSAFGGATVPLTLLPAWVNAVAPICPAYWGLMVMQGSIRGHTADVLHGGAVLLGIAVIAGAVACWRIARGWNKPELI